LWTGATALYLAGCGLLLHARYAEWDADIMGHAFKDSSEGYPVGTKAFEDRYPERGRRLLLPLKGAFTQAWDDWESGKGRPIPPPGPGRELPALELDHRWKVDDPHVSRGWVGLGHWAGCLLAAGGMFLLLGVSPAWSSRLAVAVSLLLPMSLVRFLDWAAPAHPFCARAIGGQLVPDLVLPLGPDRATAGVREWCAQEGYTLAGTSEWDVVPVPQEAAPRLTRDVLGRVTVFYVVKAPPWDRWHLAGGLCRRRAPDLSILVVSCQKPAESYVKVVPFTLLPEIRPGDATLTYEGEEVGPSLLEHLKGLPSRP
jgi:hypothetical protein